MSGACDFLPRPTEQVYGATRQDQRWIDLTVEAELEGCRFAPPAARADPRREVVIVDDNTPTPHPQAKPAPKPKPKPKPKKHSLLRRLLIVEK